MAQDNKGKTAPKDLTYFLGSIDNLGNIISQVQLGGNNYDDWARALRTSLKAKRKLEFVDGTISKPTTIEKLEDRNTVHSMLVAWITNTIEPTIRSTLSHYDDACTFWKALKERFSVVSGTRICQLKTPLGDCKQGPTEAVATFLGRLTKIWDELTTYVVLPRCECGKCTCGISAQLEHLNAEDRLYKFLIGLDSKAYGVVRFNLLNQVSLPSLNRAYQQIIQEERLRSGDSTIVEEARENIMAFKIQFAHTSKPKFTDKSEDFCTHCHREGHDMSTCFQLHGFPKWWGDRLAVVED